eukprot:gene29686-biopygen26640
MAALPPSPSLSIVSSVPLRDTCTRIPLLGLGSSHQQGGLTAQAVRAALDNGIRLIDTAQRPSVLESCAALQTSYLDLLLLHWPGHEDGAAGRLEAWRCLEEMLEEGQ